MRWNLTNQNKPQAVFISVVLNVKKQGGCVKIFKIREQKPILNVSSKFGISYVCLTSRPRNIPDEPQLPSFSQTIDRSWNMKINVFVPLSSCFVFLNKPLHTVVHLVFKQRRVRFRVRMGALFHFFLHQISQLPLLSKMFTKCNVSKGPQT